MGVGKGAALVVAAAVLVGCQQEADDRVVSATDLVRAYLEAAAGQDELRGWSFLGPDIKALMYENDVNIYLDDVRDASWMALSWEVDNVSTDDDFVFVRLRAASGVFPAYLSERRANLAIAPGDGPLRTFSVRFGLFTRELTASGG